MVNLIRKISIICTLATAFFLKHSQTFLLTTCKFCHSFVNVFGSVCSTLIFHFYSCGESLRQATIKCIAYKLNMSPSIVSRALHDHPDINPTTKAKAQRCAKELHYQSNTIAQNSKRQKFATIGVIVPQVKHFFFAEVMSGISDIAYHAGIAGFL